MAGEYENTVFIFNISRHVWAYIIAGIFNAFTVLFSGYLIYTHFKWNQDIKLRLHVIRIILLLPIYSITAYAGLLNKDHMEYYTLVRDAYEAVVIYSFAQFLFDYLGGPKRLILLATYNVSPFPGSVGSEVTENDVYFSPEGEITNTDGEVIGKMELVVDDNHSHDNNNNNNTQVGDQEDEQKMDNSHDNSHDNNNITNMAINTSTINNHPNNHVEVTSPTTVDHTFNDELNAYATSYKKKKTKVNGVFGDLKERLLGSSNNSEHVDQLSTPGIQEDEHIVTLSYMSLNATHKQVNITAHDRLALQAYIAQHPSDVTPISHARKRKHKHMMPASWFCTKPVRPGRFVFLTKYGVLQYVPIEIFCSMLAFILYSTGKYEAGEWKLDNAYPYISIILNCSQMWAMYALVWFYHEYAIALAPCQPFWKFIAVKAVVFFTFWQSVMISMYSWIFPVPCKEKHHSASIEYSEETPNIPTRKIDYLSMKNTLYTNHISSSTSNLPFVQTKFQNSHSYRSLSSTSDADTPYCDKNTWSTSQRAVALNNFLICIEMAVFAVLFSRVFSYTQFVYTGGDKKEGREQYQPPNAVVDDRTMVKKIVTFFSPKDLLKDIGSQLHPRNFKKLIKDEEESLDQEEEEADAAQLMQGPSSSDIAV